MWPGSIDFQLLERFWPDCQNSKYLGCDKLTSDTLIGLAVQKIVNQWEGRWGRCYKYIFRDSREWWQWNGAEGNRQISPISRCRTASLPVLPCRIYLVLFVRNARCSLLTTNEHGYPGNIISSLYNGTYPESFLIEVCIPLSIVGWSWCWSLLSVWVMIIVPSFVCTALFEDPIPFWSSNLHTSILEFNARMRNA